MIYLIAAAVRGSTVALTGDEPRLLRDFRRFNLPVQLALVAAADVVRTADDRATLAVVSLAPCQNGSPELYRWAEAAKAAGAAGRFGAARMNPTHTLHVIDNLALSAFVIAYQNDGYCLGVGGAPGQAWCGLEVVCDRLAAGTEREVLLMAGDQACAADGSGSIGVALLFAAARRPYPPLQQPVAVTAVQRRRAPALQPVSPHAAEGLRGLLEALEGRGPGSGRFIYTVPPAHTDGMEHVSVSVEIG